MTSDGNDSEADQLARLLDACKAGNELAREQLWTLVHKKVVQIVKKKRVVWRNGDSTNAAATEAIIKLLSAMKGKELSSTPSKVFGYIAAAVKSVVNDLYKKYGAKKRNVLTVDISNLLLASTEKHGIDDAEQVSTYLDRLLRSNPELFDTLMLKYFAEMSTREIASIQEITTQAVLARVRRATEIMRQWESEDDR